MPEHKGNCGERYFAVYAANGPERPYSEIYWGRKDMGFDTGVLS